jgi:hypothetical protein
MGRCAIKAVVKYIFLYRQYPPQVEGRGAHKHASMSHITFPPRLNVNMSSIARPLRIAVHSINEVLVIEKR